MVKKLAYIQILVIAIFFCLFSTGFAAQESGELSGVWENKQYMDGVWKLIFQADGSYKAFSKVKTSENTIIGKCKIVEKWKDTEGCLCYKATFQADKGRKSFCLIKVSASGKMLEYVEDFQEYPKMFTSEIYTYRKLYRK